jgi:hypothetical protein
MKKRKITLWKERRKNLMIFSQKNVEQKIGRERLTRELFPLTIFKIVRINSQSYEKNHDSSAENTGEI